VCCQVQPDGTERKVEEVEEREVGEDGLLSRIKKIFHWGADGKEHVKEEVVVEKADTRPPLDRLTSTEDFLSEQRAFWDARPDPKIVVSEGQQFPSISPSPEIQTPSSVDSDKKEKKKNGEDKKKTGSAGEPTSPVTSEEGKKPEKLKLKKHDSLERTSRDGSESPSLVSRFVTKTKKIFETETGPDGKEIVVEVEAPEEPVTSTTIKTTTTVKKKPRKKSPEPKKTLKDKDSKSKDRKSKSPELDDKPHLERLKSTEEFLQSEQQYWAARPVPDQPIAKAEESPKKKSKQEKIKKSASSELTEQKPIISEEGAPGLLKRRIKRTKIIIRRTRGPDGKVHETREVVPEEPEDIPHDEAAPVKKTRKLIFITVNEDGTETKTEEEIDVPAEGKGDPWATKIVIRKVKIVRKTVKPDGSHDVVEEERDEPVHVLEKDDPSAKTSALKKTVFIEVGNFFALRCFTKG